MSTSIQTLGDITSFKWATVTAINPVAIRLDGDTAALALIPDSLIDPTELLVGDRVRVELSLRKCVIHGANNGSRRARKQWVGGGAVLASGTVLNPSFNGLVAAATSPATQPAGEALMSYGMNFARYDTASIAGTLEFEIDGVLMVSKRWHSHAQPGKLWPTLVYRTLVTAGVHTYNVRVRVDSGSASTEAWDGDWRVSVTN